MLAIDAISLMKYIVNNSVTNCGEFSHYGMGRVNFVNKGVTKCDFLVKLGYFLAF